MREEKQVWTTEETDLRAALGILPSDPGVSHPTPLSPSPLLALQSACGVYAAVLSGL